MLERGWGKTRHWCFYISQTFFFTKDNSKVFVHIRLPFYIYSIHETIKKQKYRKWKVLSRNYSPRLAHLLYLSSTHRPEPLSEPTVCVEVEDWIQHTRRLGKHGRHSWRQKIHRYIWWAELLRENHHKSSRYNIQQHTWCSQLAVERKYNITNGGYSCCKYKIQQNTWCPQQEEYKDGTVSQTMSKHPMGSPGEATQSQRHPRNFIYKSKVPCQIRLWPLTYPCKQERLVWFGWKVSAVWRGVQPEPCTSKL